MTVVARLACDQPTAARLAAHLGESLDNAVCAAFEDEDGQWRLAVHFLDPPDAAALRAQVALAAGEDAAAALSIETMPDTDWIAESLAGLRPVRAGRFLVHGAHDRLSVKPNDIGIEIEAALAFGTGHHGTTRGCLLALDDLAKRRRSIIPPLKGEGRSREARSGWGRYQEARNPHLARGVYHRAALRADPLARHPPPYRGRDKKVLDVGTGTGILAMAAAKRLRVHVVASDIDRVAVKAARGNARLNRIGPTITFVRAAGTRARAISAGAPYDLIFANILLGPLTRLAAPLARLTTSRSRIVLSGLLPAHANAALAVYRAQGFRLERRIPLEGWMTLVMKRR